MGKVLDLNKIQKPKEREAATAKLLAGTESLGVYSPEDVTVIFNGEPTTVKKGFHTYSPAFAVWLVQKYGPESTYGKCYYTVKEGGKDVTKPYPVMLDYEPTPKQAELPTPKAK